MAETVRVKINETSAKDVAQAALPMSVPVSIRVSPNSYFAVFFVLTFLTGFLVYLEKDVEAALLCLVNWLLLPALALSDKIVFDGKTLKRNGIFPKFWAMLNRRPERLKISQIEQIETQALRALKRGGNIFYRYRTSVRGNGLRFDFASGGEDYRRMTEKLFSAVATDALDNRSLELRDYLAETKEVVMKAEFALIPSTEVLENSLEKIQNSAAVLRRRQPSAELSVKDSEKAEDLRRLANELRLAGYLLQSLEAFRRALYLKPDDAHLIFEFARCLHSYASLERNRELIKRAKAALRLAERKTPDNHELLARIGECYFQYGDRERAKNCFQKALIGETESFRAVRGLAEIALREGKIAHVIHHFASAGHFAANAALRRWAHNETDYFSRLNDDEEYMEAEIKRIKRLENIERGRSVSLRVVIAGMIVILFGLLFDENMAKFGWAISMLALSAWLILIVGRNLLIQRNPLPAED